MVAWGSFHSGLFSIQALYCSVTSFRRISPIRHIQQFAVSEGGLVGHDAGGHVAYGFPGIDGRRAIVGNGIDKFVNKPRNPSRRRSPPTKRPTT